MRTGGWMRRREIVAISDKETFIAMLQMQDLLAKSMRDFKEGSIVKGRILEIRPREVLVDIGYKIGGRHSVVGIRRHRFA